VLSSQFVGLESWTWTRVRFLADLDLDSAVKDSDLDLDITCLQTTAKALSVHLDMNSIHIIITAQRCCGISWF